MPHDLGEYTFLVPGQPPLTGRASMEIAPSPGLKPLGGDFGPIEMTFEGDFSGMFDGVEMPIARDMVRRTRELIETFLQKLKGRGAIYDVEIETRPDRPGELWITLPPPPIPLERITLPLYGGPTFADWISSITLPMPACKKRSRRSRRRWRGHLKSQGLYACARART